MSRKAQADSILYGRGLFRELEKYGEPHVIGSYRMDLMAWNDLDVDIVNDTMAADQLYKLTEWILKTFHPTWYEAKEEISGDGKKVWFHGFEAYVEDALWNVDLWFFDRETIRLAESYCDEIAQKARSLPGAEERIVLLKQELMSRGMYGMGLSSSFGSMDVYEAVLNQHITDIDDFLSNYKKK